MVSLAGGANDAVIAYVPRAGAPALAVVLPEASTRPALSVIRHVSAASNTLASPLIVIGGRRREFARGRATVMKPRAEVSGVVLGVLLTEATAAVDRGVGLSDATGIGTLPPHAPMRSATKTRCRVTRESPAHRQRARAAHGRARRRRASPRSPPSPRRRAPQDGPARWRGRSAPRPTAPRRTRR